MSFWSQWNIDMIRLRSFPEGQFKYFYSSLGTVLCRNAGQSSEFISINLAADQPVLLSSTRITKRTRPATITWATFLQWHIRIKYWLQRDPSECRSRQPHTTAMGREAPKSYVKCSCVMHSSVRRWRFIQMLLENMSAVGEIFPEVIY